MMTLPSLPWRQKDFLDMSFPMDTLESPTTPNPPPPTFLQPQLPQRLQQLQQQANNSQLSSYTSREYDAAHMLVNYSTQPRQQPTQQSQQQQQSPIVPTTGLMDQPLFSQSL